MILRKCSGCGAQLQDTDPDKMGFIPNLTLESKYCKRCFRLMHYNELPKVVAKSEDYERVIDDVIKRNGLIVFIVDIFQFKSTFNKQMIDKIRNKDVILVANKYDTFPHSVNISNIVNWLSKECEKIFFRVLAIHIVSSKKGHYIKELTNTIDMARRGRDVYFVGCANVGKSSLVNSLIKNNTSKKDDVISTSVIPGTTLNEIRIPFFEDNKALIDTPGLINTSDVLEALLPISYKKIMPDNEMKPKTFQITDGNTLSFAGLAFLSFKCDDRLSVTMYTSNNLYIHRCKTERLDDLINTQLGKLLNPPTIDEASNIEYKDINIKLDGKDKKDIWFSGFGFVEIIGKCDIDIKVIKNTEVYVTNAIIGSSKEASR